jgi:O-antigen/teichoic acid export membrane protein
MALSKAVAKNTAFQAGGKVVGLALSLISAGMIFPYLGEGGVGQYTAILSLLQIFGIMMDFGLYIVLIKRISVLDETSAPQVNNIFTLRLLSGVIFLSLAPLTAWIVSFYSDFYTSEIILGVALTTLFFLFISLNQLLSAIFQKHLKTGWIALAELLGKIALLGMTVLVISQGWGLLWVMATLVVSSGINFVVNFIASRRYFKIRLAADLTIWKSVMKEAWPIGVSIAFALLYFKGDTVLLTFYETEEIVGEYGAPYKILEVLVTFPAIFTGLVLPPLTQAWRQKKMDDFRSVLQKSFDALLMIALPMVAGTLVLAPYIMDLLVPEGFTNSDRMLQILMVATGAIFIGTLFGYAVPALEKQKTMMWGYIAIALTSLAAYLVVIPRYSIEGAAWVTVYSEVMVMLIAGVIVLNTTNVRLRWSGVLRTTAAALLMWAVLVTIQPAFVETLQAILAEFEVTLSTRGFAVLFLGVTVPFGAAVYATVLLLSGALRMDDVKAILRMRS